jgi:hypothetical protein
MLKQQFDIFSGSPDNEPFWLEVTDGLADAIAFCGFHGKRRERLLRRHKGESGSK